MPPLENPIEEDDALEVFGDLPDDEDLSALDRGDSIEEIPPTDPEPEAKAPEPEPEPEPVPEPEPDPVVAKEPEPEPEPVAKEPEPEPEPKPDVTVPKARLDAQIAKTRATEAELERLRQEQAEEAKKNAPPEYDFKAKIGEEYEAVLQGDTDKAAAIRLEIEEQRIAMQTAQFQQLAAQTTNQTKAQLEFDAVVKDLTNEYPVFDPEADTFNQELLDDVLFKRDAYHAQGMPLADALMLATTEVAKLNDLSSATAAPAPEKPSLAKPPESKVDPKEVEKKIEASNAQPPDIQGEASDAHGSTALNFDNMTEEEFDALPESTLRRYRGD